MIKNKKKTIGIMLTILIILLNISCTKSNKNVEKTNMLNTLTKEEVADGWQLLFDGESFEGWRGIGITGIPTGYWKIDKGSIQKIVSEDAPTRKDGRPLKGSDLMTKKTFKNFELRFEWKVSEGSNSGVKYNVIEEFSIKNGSASGFGFEYQVLDDETYKDNLKPKQNSASLYTIIESNTKVLKPVGEYNTARIVLNKNHLEHWLNGTKVLEADIDTPEFDELFQKSKYKMHSDFTEHKDGHIVLQDHGFECWYRNIKIKVFN
ncbi:MAG: DUF1080 domain-containing protein [Melioribacteraceae bacterium]|nr:DUF1080 domain-containing protein [Melioribacteraceae bacterium]